MKQKKFYETKSAKAEIKKWDKILKNAGFDDIETDFEKENSVVSKQQITIDHGRVVYFEQCKVYLHSGLIKHKCDLFIFENHCDGISNVQIAEMLPANGFRTLDRRSVDRRILAVLKIAGIKPIVFNF